MTTALIISEFMPIHDDALVADIDAAFDEMDRDLRAAQEQAEREALLRTVDWLLADMLGERASAPRESLEISLQLQIEEPADVLTHDSNRDDEVANVAEVA